MRKLIQSLRRKQAFTLVELMIVVTIIAILALIAIPLYSANTTAAIMSEGVAGAGTLRTACGRTTPRTAATPARRIRAPTVAR